MAAPSEEMLQQATAVAARIAVLGKRFVRSIWLTDWRGWRFLYDAPSLQNCNNDCQNCPLYKLNDEFLRLEQGLPFSLSLFEWTDQVDRDYYGPERFLNCKTAQRQMECFLACMLCDPQYRDPDKLREEMALVRDLRPVFSEWYTPELDSIQRGIVETALKGADYVRRQHLRQILADFGWNGQTFR